MFGFYLDVMYEQEDPFHSFLEHSWQYEIVSFCFHQSLDQEFETFLDITLSNGDVVRRLRFYSPQDIEVEKGFPRKASGFCIFDVSARGLEKLSVRVDDLEGNWGAVQFWARAVEEIKQSVPT